MNTPISIVDRVVLQLGTYAELSRVVGVSRQAVTVWKSIPPRHAKAIEEATGIPRHELCPDVFEPPE